MLIETVLGNLGVQYFTDEDSVVANLMTVDQPALKRNGKLGDGRGVDRIGGDGGESRLGNFVMLSARGYAEVIALTQEILRRHIHRKGLVVDDVSVRIGGLAQGDVHAGRTRTANPPPTTPSPHWADRPYHNYPR